METTPRYNTDPARPPDPSPVSPPAHIAPPSAKTNDKVGTSDDGKDELCLSSQSPDHSYSEASRRHEIYRTPVRPRNPALRLLDDMASTPFVPAILHHEHPVGLSMPKFQMYDGSGDPFDHLMHFRQVMTLYSMNDALLCKVFPSSLQGPALSWFHRLPANSVNSFRGLSETFATHYLCSLRRKQGVASLFHLKMNRNESIREFMKRFGGVILQLDSVSLDVVMQAVKGAVIPNTPFFNSISLDPPCSIDDLFQRANKYAILEDDLLAASQRTLSVAQEESRRPRRDEARHSTRRQYRSRPEYERGVELGRKYTQLTLQPSRLLPIVQSMEGFAWPQPLRASADHRDRAKFCDYHREHGHVTDNCRHLRHLLETMVQMGKLRQYVKASTDDNESGRVAERTATLPQNRPEIAMIREGPSLHPSSSKKVARDPLPPCMVASIQYTFAALSIQPIDGSIVFKSESLQRLASPHEDALVLALEVGGHLVRRILVDSGSSADLLHLPAFLQMGYKVTALHASGRVLTGFNGSQTTSLGDIVLPVTAGPVTMFVSFTVIDDPSQYNVILGRTWLHRMKVVPSTYHQVLSFMTPRGQVDIHGDQMIARRCHSIRADAPSASSK